MTIAAANRGKYAEGKVKALLKKLESANCTHARWPDARAGSFVVAPADFMILQDGYLRLVEVKEVDHEYRLPYKNLEQGQLARLLMWQAAGAGSWVLVYHTPIKLWRCIPAQFFLHRPLLSDTGKPMGSWKLTEFEPKTLVEAFGLTKK